ncbi:hypothetical protein J6590_038660 [Homalodisca vitripennis]|nr:hypothetical protein J6590_038660 [Homalodisca vitripennis]
MPSRVQCQSTVRFMPPRMLASRACSESKMCYCTKIRTIRLHSLSGRQIYAGGCEVGSVPGFEVAVAASSSRGGSDTDESEAETCAEAVLRESSEFLFFIIITSNFAFQNNKIKCLERNSEGVIAPMAPLLDPPLD